MSQNKKNYCNNCGRRGHKHSLPTNYPNLEVKFKQWYRKRKNSFENSNAKQFITNCGHFNSIKNNSDIMFDNNNTTTTTITTRNFYY